MAGIGIFGGTFDPIHLGHLRCALEVSRQLSLGSMHFIPSAMPVHRSQPVAKPAQRLAMVQKAVESVPGWIANDCELRRNKPSYTVETLVELRATLSSDDPFWFLIGSDAFEGLLSWHRWEELLTLTNLAVMVRGGNPPRCCPQLEALITAPSQETTPFGQVKLVQVTPLSIASTQIRAELAKGQLPHFLVSESVLEYIQHQGIYGYKE